MYSNINVLIQEHPQQFNTPGSQTSNTATYY